ncbi:hypothetical protein C4K30_2413 [Pseudomonas chlororaphis subsp. piscium]|nr:hypothetical protein C4K30_2413 [Pseudomonas chlororaphis subsp. piscium]
MSPRTPRFCRSEACSRWRPHDRHRRQAWRPCHLPGSDL